MKLTLKERSQVLEYTKKLVESRKLNESVPEEKKPKVKLVGQDGNVFNLIGLCSRALKKAGMKTEADEMAKKIFSCGSYDEALQIMMDYCDVS